MNWFLGLFIVVVSFGAAAMQPLTDKQLDDVTAGKTPPVGKPAVVCCQKSGNTVKGVKNPAKVKL